MVAKPAAWIRRAAHQLLDAGAALIAGHSAHVFHGVASRVLFDLGDFLDDYAVHPQLRNDLGLLWLAELDPDLPPRLGALPIALDYCFTRQASPREAEWITRRLRELCAPFGTQVEVDAGGLIELSAERVAE
jgi:poly-gamma-glutamate synthesis protein (capsule biosynthesis protein)